MKQIYDNKDIGETIDKSFDAGIKEGYRRCMEQMMEKAVESTVENGIFLSSMDCARMGYNLGDKVRVIVCKKKDEK